MTILTTAALMLILVAAGATIVYAIADVLLRKVGR